MNVNCLFLVVDPYVPQSPVVDNIHVMITLYYPIPCGGCNKKKTAANLKLTNILCRINLFIRFIEITRRFLEMKFT